MMSNKSHWEKVFTGKPVNELSWYQQTPQQSLDFVEQLAIPKTAAIIDIGAGDSFFVDHLLQKGFSNITVLDMSIRCPVKQPDRRKFVSNKTQLILLCFQSTIKLLRL